MLADTGAATPVTIGTSNVSLLTGGTFTVAGRATGDVLNLDAGFTVTNNAGGIRNYTVDVVLGSTVLLTMIQQVANASTRDITLQAVIRVGASGIQGIGNLASGLSPIWSDTGTATEDLATGVALDIRIRANAAGTQEAALVMATLVGARR